VRRVVITGAGAVTPLGLNAVDTWAAMRAGRSAIRRLQDPPHESVCDRLAAQVTGFDGAAHFDARRLSQLDRSAQLALVAAREAVTQSRLAAGELRGPRTAVVVGSGAAGQNTQDEQFRRLYGEQNARVHPLTIVRLMANASASQLSIEFGAQGAAFVIASACASNNHAMAMALRMIRSGEADIVLAGGTEACISYGTLKSWEAMRVLADDDCRPFCAGRRGLVLGEGAAIFVLETLDSARRRGATPLAELAGAGISSDADDLVFPSVEGTSRAIAAALADAGLAPQQIGYINAHGTGTLANDLTETRAIHAVFGDHARHLAVSSTKSMHGHALGAAGAIELIAALGALSSGVLPPTLNLDRADPECDLDYVPHRAVTRPVDAVLSNSFAFGGLNAVLALKRCEGSTA
jgi:nodulation protein E